MPREPDWQLFDLLTEFRRRVRALKLENLTAEPPWISALPTEDALIARTMLMATRAWAAKQARAAHETHGRHRAHGSKVESRKSRKSAVATLDPRGTHAPR